MNMPLLRADHISCGYGKNEVVHSISFECFAGERISIIGANGCGKTTLLKALCSFIPLMSGAVTVCKKNVHNMARRDIASKMALMAQLSEVWFDFTVLECVLMGRYCKRRGFLDGKSSNDVNAARKYLDAVGMLDFQDRLITSLSGGQRQRVLLARAFAQEPSVILLDEPTNHLDLKHQVELLDFLKEWVSVPGRALIQVMHDLNLARHYCDRVLLMHDGRLVMSGTPHEVMNSAALNDSYEFDIRGFMQRSYGDWV